MSDDVIAELIELNQRLLDSITEGDWTTYEALCDPRLTAFEPEAQGQLVEGMDFHRFYFQLGGMEGPHQTTMTAPHVRVMGDVAIVSCVRLIQHLGEESRPITSRFEETRVWQRQQDGWKHIHFHRSAL